MQKVLSLLLLALLAGCGQRTFPGLSSVAKNRVLIPVAKNGIGDCTTVQAAIDAAKAFLFQRIVIFIKNGIYRKKVLVPACNTLLTLKGESTSGALISWDDHFSKMNRDHNSTSYTSKYTTVKFFRQWLPHPGRRSPGENNNHKKDEKQSYLPYFADSFSSPAFGKKKSKYHCRGRSSRKAGRKFWFY